MKKLDKGRAAAMACEGGYEALQSMLKGEYTEESTGARTIRQTGGKDRHSKVFTARGPRDRRVRLSVATAIRFYDLQDRLGFEQPSKAVEWLLLHCQPSIQALPQLASLHPVRVAAIPQPACLDHDPHDHQQESCEDHHQKPQKSFLDAGMHQNRDHSVYQYNYTAHHQSSLHNIGPFPLCTTDSHLQDSIEEDPSQYSNPSSSGASSDHPISFSEASQPHCKVALTDAISIMANHAASSAASMHCGSASFASPAIVHTNKRHRMQLHHVQNQDGLARLASSGTSAANISMSAGRSLGVINNGLSSPMSSSSFGNTARFNSLMINDEDARMLMTNSIEGQLNEDSMQHIMALPSLANYKPNRYADMAQQLFSTAQAVNQLANDGHQNIAVNVQGACNVQSSRELAALDIHGEACTSNNCTSSTMHDSLQLYNKIALQQVDVELACSNMYASPSPSESTSINTLAAAYNNSKSGHGNHANNTMLGDQSASILYRSNWNPSAGL